MRLGTFVIQWTPVYVITDNVIIQITNAINLTKTTRHYYSEPTRNYFWLILLFAYILSEIQWTSLNVIIDNVIIQITNVINLTKTPRHYYSQPSKESLWLISSFAYF